MRILLKNQRKNRLIVAALAVGSFSLPAAVSSQTTTTHKKPAQSAAHSASSNATSGTKKSSAKSGKSSNRKTSKRVKGQAAPTPERISEIQDALGKHGVYSGSPTGKWDDSTTDAMKKFQSANGLTPTGKFDALTLQKLGLGSETAGLAPPTPPPNAAANRLLSSKIQRDEIKNEPE
jgi:peptidoglycan hydrolase-like protein with peptidoglycan-binding domain